MKTMDQEFNVNKFAVEYLDKNLERIVTIAYDVLKGTKNKIKIKIRSTYKSYLTNITLRYAKTKSFFYRDEPVLIEKFYIPLKLKFKERNIGNATANNIFRKSNYVIINGLAGCGKSILMKFLVMDILKNTNLIPAFIELRELNNRDIDVIDLIEETLLQNKLELDTQYFNKAFKEGQFIFLLDGFDEIDYEKREKIKISIFKFVKLYSDCKIIISSRPDLEFSGWKDFVRMDVRALDISDAIMLIEKIPYDEAVKINFIQDLKKELFKRHISFLSNPLLLSIMLLTYTQSSNIPTKLNVFYNQAYEALYQRHDALKGGFKRKRFTELDIQDYARIFSAFCAQSYDRRQFQFLRTDAIRILNKSKEITNINFNSNNYLNDTLQSTCLLMEDGLWITFTHRSFQEYFTAKFIIEANPDVQKALVDKFRKNIKFDSVFEILFEIDSEMLEKLFILPQLIKIFNEINLKNKVGLIHYSKYIKYKYSRFEVKGDEWLEIQGYLSDANSEFNISHVVSFILKQYGYEAKTHLTDDKREKYFYNKYKHRESIDTSKLNSKSEFIKDLSEYGGYFSKYPLEFLLKTKNEILKRHKKTTLSIEEIILNR